MERKNVKTIALTDEEKESVEEHARRVDRPVASYFRWLHSEYIRAMDDATDDALGG
jgi:predicted DNA-binding protein